MNADALPVVLTSKPSRPSTSMASIERLPAEILEPILLNSGNGNLLRASPRIAVKLSGSKNLFLAFFFLGFFRRDVPALREHFNLQSLLPSNPPSAGSWERRNLMMTVLRSRWCTLAWLLSLSKEIMCMAAEFVKQELGGVQEVDNGLRKTTTSTDSVPGASPSNPHPAAGNPLKTKFGWVTVVASSLFSLKIFPGKKAPVGVRAFEPELPYIWSISTDCLASRMFHEAFDASATFVEDRGIPMWHRLVTNPHMCHILTSDTARTMDDQEFRNVDSICPSIRKFLFNRLKDQRRRLSSDMLRQLLEAMFLFHPEQKPYKLHRRFFLEAARRDDSRLMLTVTQLDPDSAPAYADLKTTWWDETRKAREEWAHRERLDDHRRSRQPLEHPFDEAYFLRMDRAEAIRSAIHKRSIEVRDLLRIEPRVTRNHNPLDPDLGDVAEAAVRGLPTVAADQCHYWSKERAEQEIDVIRDRISMDPALSGWDDFYF